ncbi:thioredoxin family protein [Neobacillus rhizosphaerae]|uniref:thioredoxin family protein n=1 Tax=Neobacillus rhizosphaerae TaxID=2880965 RepID=UPI003D2D5A0F
MRIVKIEADVCPQCRALDFILMATPEVNAVIEKVNIDRDENKDWIEKYTIMGTPTLLFLDGERELTRLVGAKGTTPEIIREKVKEAEEKL